MVDDLVEFPPLGSEDLIRLGEDLLHVYPIYCEEHNTRQDGKYVSSISEVVVRGKNSATGLSSEEATALAEMFRKVPPVRQLSSQCLMPLVIRPYPDGLKRVAVRTRGPDF